MLLQFISIPDGIQEFLEQNKDIEIVVLTMLAVYILEFKFKNKKDEWDMICSKAKKWIRQQEVDADRKKAVEKRAKEFAQTMTEEEELAAMAE